jgi:hypothetical protein
LTAVQFVISIIVMNLPTSSGLCKAASLVLFSALCLQQTTLADWQRTDTSIAWRHGSNVVWAFSFDSTKGKPFFHPLTGAGATALTNFKPEDHPWHYGLWFSWKYINRANYWEEDRNTGRAEGATRWSTPLIETTLEGAATIQLELTYTHPTGRVDMTESRRLHISAPASDGSYTIDWRGRFIAGKEGAILDRTPMPGEPDGRVNGGYAGLGLRMASSPFVMSTVCSTGLVNRFESDRARPAAPAVACNFSDAGRDVGGIAIFSDAANAGENAPWYVINSQQMRFACAAILAPAIRTLKPGEPLELNYRIVVRPNAWTAEALRAVQGAPASMRQ